MSSSAIVLTATTGCTQPSEIDDGYAEVTEAQVSLALVTPADLAGNWHPAGLPDRDPASLTKTATSDSACDRATLRLAEESSKWSQAEVDVKVAYSRSMPVEMLLKQEIAVDSDLEAERLADPLRRQADSCRDVVIVGDEVTVESHLQACELGRGGPGVQVVQSWTTSSGQSGSTRLAYLFRDHLLAVVTLTSADGSVTCNDAVFGRILEDAAGKISRLGLPPQHW